MSKDGQGKFGDSPVVGLGNIIRCTTEYERTSGGRSIYASNLSYQRGSAAKAIFKALALEAIIRFQEYCESEERVSIAFCSQNEKMLNEFVDLCYEWVNNEIKEA